MKLRSLRPRIVCGLLSLLIGAATTGLHAGSMHILSGHLPASSARTQPLERLPSTNSLQLTISLPLRNQDALGVLLQQLYDPASPNYHQFLSPAQFNEQFGPTAQQYESAINFATSNGLEIVTRRDSRILLGVSGKVSDVEKAFHVSMWNYQDPAAPRQFYAPDIEPTIDASVPILDVAGLESYAVAKSALHKKTVGNHPISASGSQASGYYLGSDFRHAYVPGVNLTGTGQSVGLLELDGYYSSDITAYETLAHLPNVPLVNVTNGYTGPPGDGVTEVSLDIEMAIAMAPGLSSVVVYEGSQTSNVVSMFEYIVDNMAASNQIKQFSSSWGYTGPASDPTLDGELMKLATQGQSFYQASGDGDAWYNTIWVPAASTNLTCVGGTQLTMNGAGVSYSSETVWNEGNQGTANEWSPNGAGYIGSGGGVSTAYSIPPWQAGVNNSSNSASGAARNIPDVALTGDDIWVTYGDGQAEPVGGTSCAAPLWAAFTALVNQQATAAGFSNVGFINPAIYSLRTNLNYSSVFHDITTGNNTNKHSHNLYFAVGGYDLCTGLGTPAGAPLINALSPEPLIINPTAGFVASGHFGGPFNVTNQGFTLTNIGSNTLTWNLANLPSWLAASSTGGTLLSKGAAVTVNIGLASAATNLTVGAYTNLVWFTNANDTTAQSRQFVLTVIQASPALTWPAPAGITYGTPLTSNQLDAGANIPGAFAYTPAAAAVLTVGTNTLKVAFTPTDTNDYTGANLTETVVVSPAPLSVTANNASRAYGTNNPAFTGTITGVVNGDNITAACTCSATSNSPLGNYTIVAGLSDPQDRETNYIVSLTNATLTITQASPGLTWTPSNITYGTALGTNQLDATARTAGTFVYNPPAGAILNSGMNLLSVMFTPNDSTDYMGANASVNLAVSPAPLTVTASNATRPYECTNPIFTGSIVGVQNGDNITATFSCAATTNSPAGNYPIIPALVDPDNRATNYSVTLSNGVLTVRPLTPVLSWSNPSNIIYGTALCTNQLDATANVSGSFAYNPTGGTVLCTGTNTLSVTFYPNDSTDYVSAVDSVSLIVCPTPLSVTASNACRAYGAANPLFGGTIAGLQNNDNITAAYTSSASNSSPVGTYPIVPNLVDPDDLETNYIVSLTNGTLTVTQAVPVLTWAAPSNINYPMPLCSNTLDAAANVPGGFAYTPPAGTVLAPGTNTLGVLFTPADTNDYLSATDSVNLVVNLVPIRLHICATGTNVVLRWNDPDALFMLQSAGMAGCVFSNVSCEMNPYTNAGTNAQQFFRLISN